MAEIDRALVVPLDRCLTPVDTRAETRLARWTGSETAAADLPLEPSVVQQLQARAAADQRLYLIAETRHPAQELAQQLGLFDGVILRDATTKESLQAAARRHLKGDVEIWPQPGAPGGTKWRDLWRALRPHYWAKSFLVFLPLIAARQWDDGAAMAGAAIALVVMSLASSAIYLLNDLWDLSGDRRDPLRRDRPIAAGRVGVRMAAAMALVCLGLALGLAGLTGGGLLAAVAAYAGCAFLYSLRLKSWRYVDVLWLSMLHTMRVVAGGAASGTPLSAWLIALCLALFVSLACAKRVSELSLAGPDPTNAQSRRPYDPGQLPGLMTLGLGAGLAAGGTLLAYAGLGPGQALYVRPAWLIAVALCLLVWLARIWRAALTGHLGTDPILFALRDGVSWTLAVMLGISLWSAAG